MYNANQPILNQLLRQRDSVENLITQYSQPQQPIQNIINTGMATDFEARILKDDEQVENILINKKTMFLDKKNKKLWIKELDGTISEQYEIVVPKDEKDIRIEELEKRLKDMESKINEYEQPIRAVNGVNKSYTNDDGYAKPEPKTTIKQFSKPTK